MSVSSQFLHLLPQQAQCQTPHCPPNGLPSFMPPCARPCCAFCQTGLSSVLSIGQSPPHVWRLLFLGHWLLSTPGDWGLQSEHSESKDRCFLLSLTTHCVSRTLVPQGAQNVPSVPHTPFLSSVLPACLPSPPAPNHHHLSTLRKLHPPSPLPLIPFSNT